MKPHRTLIPALLYAALSLGANPVAGQTLTDVQRTEIEGMRSGDMRKLVVHESPLEVTGEGFTDKDGAPITFDDSNGRLRLVNFWATWCAPCRQEKPALDALQRDLGGEKFEVIAIATGRNDLDAIERFNEEVGASALETHLDSKSTLARAMQVPGLPVTVVLNREGAEIARLMGGADWEDADARAIIETLIALP